MVVTGGTKSSAFSPPVRNKNDSKHSGSDTKGKGGINDKSDGDRHGIEGEERGTIVRKGKSELETETSYRDKAKRTKENEEGAQYGLKVNSNIWSIISKSGEKQKQAVRSATHPIDNKSGQLSLGTQYLPRLMGNPWPLTHQYTHRLSPQNQVYPSLTGYAQFPSPLINHQLHNSIIMSAAAGVSSQQYPLGYLDRPSPSYTRPGFSFLEDELRRKQSQTIQSDLSLLTSMITQTNANEPDSVSTSPENTMKNRKNAQSRARAAKYRNEIARIQSKKETERTKEEQNTLEKFEVKRRKKNERSRQREIEKKEEIDRILQIAEGLRTSEETEFLDSALGQKRRKVEGDRLRRRRMKVLGLTKIETESGKASGISARGPLPPAYEQLARKLVNNPKSGLNEGKH